MILALAGISVATLIGYFITSLLWPTDFNTPCAIFVAPAIGIGLCSIIFIAFRRPLFVIEAGLLLVLAICWFTLKKPSMGSLQSLRTWRPPAVYLLLACGLGMAFSYWMIRVERSPHGDGDAVSIWNSHARYLYRDGASWRKTILNTFHPDYPLLTAASTARIWRYMGQEIPDSAGMLGVFYALVAVGVLTSTLAYFRGASRAGLFGLTLLATPFYVDYATSGSADVPLSLYVLVTIVLICLHAKGGSESRGLMVLAGFAAGCAGWTKNEGMLFILATSLALLTPIFRDPGLTLRRFVAFLAGIAVPMGMILWFKLAIAPPNDIFAGRQYSEMILKLVDPQRFLTVLSNLCGQFLSFGNWLVNPTLFLGYVVLVGIDRRMLVNRGWIHGVLICALVLFGYFAVYMITPMDLQWHLDSSLPRLYLHVWPAFLLLAGLIAAEPKPPESVN
jgi:hypothetical protein